MIFPSFATSLVAALSFGALATSAAPTPGPIDASDVVSNVNEITGITVALPKNVAGVQLKDVIVSRQAPTDALSLVQGLKDTVVCPLSHPTAPTYVP